MVCGATSRREDTPNNGKSFRFVFDFSYYIIIGVILLNIIFGIIIDTFGALRDETNERAEELENLCFICGTKREQ